MNMPNPALVDRLLLCTPTTPYPTLPANDSLTDATGQRFTKGDSIFTIVSHTHCYANHILAQNISKPCTLLEYPSWEQFTAEVDKGYRFVGISAFPPHLDNVMKMCEYVRRRSPASTIALGSYGGQAFEAAYDQQERSRYVDHIIHGEGVHWLRNHLGEPGGGPIRQTLMPKAGGAPVYISRFPAGNIGFLVSGLGCIGGCDFCSTTQLFDKKRIELLSPQALVEHIALYHRHFEDVDQVFVIEEDHFRQPAYLERIADHWKKEPQVLERMDWFGFGSIDYIGRFAERYGWDRIAELGLGCIFIGVESKFAGEHGYEKRGSVDAHEVFGRLHGMGIRTVGAWMCGWDWHHHGNIHEDLNYFVSLQPTYQQLTRVTPFPGTPLWEERREQGRLLDVPWEDVHFWSGAQKNVALEPHETLNLTEYGYDLLYRTWGPSILRRMQVQLNGFEYATKARSPVIRHHRPTFFKRQCAMLWTTLYGMERYAPNGVVRRRVRKTEQRYRELIGEPTPVMEALGRALESMMTVTRVREMFDPLNRHPKEEPFKRYLYDRGSAAPQGPVPYRVEMDRPPRRTALAMRSERLSNRLLSRTLAAVRSSRRRRGDPEIDDYLVDRIGKSQLGFGF